MLSQCAGRSATASRRDIGEPRIPIGEARIHEIRRPRTDQSPGHLRKTLRRVPVEVGPARDCRRGDHAEGPCRHLALENPDQAIARVVDRRMAAPAGDEACGLGLPRALQRAQEERLPARDVVGAVVELDGEQVGGRRAFERGETVAYLARAGRSRVIAVADPRVGLAADDARIRAPRVALRRVQQARRFLARQPAVPAGAFCVPGRRAQRVDALAPRQAAREHPADAARGVGDHDVLPGHPGAADGRCGLIETARALETEERHVGRTGAMRGPRQCELVTRAVVADHRSPDRAPHGEPLGLAARDFERFLCPPRMRAGRCRPGRYPARIPAGAGRGPGNRRSCW